MNKPQVLEEIVLKTGESKKASDAVISALFEVISETLAKGEDVQFVGFGTFKASEVGEKVGTIQFGQKAGQSYTTPAHKKVSFKVGSKLKEAVK